MVHTLGLARTIPAKTPDDLRRYVGEMVFANQRLACSLALNRRMLCPNDLGLIMASPTGIQRRRPRFASGYQTKTEGAPNLSAHQAGKQQARCKCLRGHHSGARPSTTLRSDAVAVWMIDGDGVD
jgi:hypothetical protein